MSPSYDEHRTLAPDDRTHSIIDARTDQRWVQLVITLTDREDWDELWKLAQKAPPIWTVRIVKSLGKRKWQPAADRQLAFFEELSKFASACNEFDLPGPETRTPTSGQIESAKSRVTAARITADGDFIFVLDEKAVVIEVLGMPDLRPVERIRLDAIQGKQYSTLGFAISRYGDRLAVLLFEPKTKRPFIHVYDLANGEVVSDRWCKFDNGQIAQHIGQQVPRLAIDGSGKMLVLLSAWNQITIWNLETGAQSAQFENKTTVSNSDSVYVPSPYSASIDANLHDWSKYGRWAMSEPFSQRLALSRDGRNIAAGRGGTVVVRNGDNLETIVGEPTSSGQFALAENGEFIITNNQEDINFITLTKQNEWALHTQGVIIAICRDPAARIALTHDSEMVAVAMSHFDIIKLWHLPDGRVLGTLQGLAHDLLVDFKIADSGSIIAVTRSGLVQLWESDGNGNAYPWSKELVAITHQPVDSSSVKILRQAQEMRKRGWLSVQESNLLDLALALMQNRLNLDIEVEWDSELPGDVFDIEIE
jgi:hypothetical protein